MYRNVLFLHLLREMSRGEECGNYTLELQNPSSKEDENFFFVSLYSDYILNICLKLILTSLTPSKTHTNPIGHHQVLVFFLLYLSWIPVPPSILLLHSLFKLPSSYTWIVKEDPYWFPYILPMSLQSALLQSQ